MLRVTIEKDGSLSTLDCDVVEDNEDNGLIIYHHRPSAASKKFNQTRLTAIQVIDNKGKVVVKLEKPMRIQIDPNPAATPPTIEQYRNQIEDEVQRIFDGLTEAHRCMFKILLMGHGYTMNGVYGTIGNRYREATRKQFGTKS